MQVIFFLLALTAILFLSMGVFILFVPVLFLMGLLWVIHKIAGVGGTHRKRSRSSK